MKYIDNDMDDLFSKAGRDYPLNTDKKNWEAVHQALLDTQGNAAAHNAKTNYLKFLPLLLLLLLPALFLIPDRRNNYSSGTETLTEGTASGTRVMDRNAKTNIDIQNDQPGADAGNMKTETKGAVKDASPLVANKGHASDEAESIESDDIGTTAPFISAGRKIVQKQPAEMNPTDQNITHSRNPGAPAERVQVTGDINRKTNFPALRPLTPKANVKTSVASLRLQNLETANTGKLNTSKKQEARNRVFYYGLAVGPDLSSIKYQKVKNIGYSAGLIAGYQFAPRWSVEMKALWSSKKYYSDGKYFDKTGAQIPSYVNIHYLDGECNMLEIPVAVRYLFTPGKNSFFATAGINSYFMNREDYDYMADAYGTPYEGYKSYKKSGNHFFSNLQLSGGYQLKILKNTNLRIEPYLQLPLNEIGIGRMPITSAGVHFGLLREIR